MIRIAILGGIGSGKTFISKLFGYPVFNADKIVDKIYLENKSILNKLKKKIPKNFTYFPIKREELIKAVLKKKNNIKKISSIVHPLVRKDLNYFLRKNKKKKIVILDIPLYLENKLDKKGDVIIFIQAKSSEALKRIKKRKNYNKRLFSRLKNLQLPLSYKKQRSDYIINNNFNENSTRKKVKDILEKI